MQVERLTKAAQDELFENIVNGLRSEQRRDEIMLQALVDWLDLLDEDDFFGTEGWKHAFSIEE